MGSGASALSSSPWAALCCVAVQADADVASEHEVRLSLCVLATSSATAAPSHSAGRRKLAWGLSVSYVGNRLRAGKSHHSAGSAQRHQVCKAGVIMFPALGKPFGIARSVPPSVCLSHGAVA